MYVVCILKKIEVMHVLRTLTADKFNELHYYFMRVYSNTNVMLESAVWQHIRILKKIYFCQCE